MSLTLSSAVAGKVGTSVTTMASNAFAMTAGDVYFYCTGSYPGAAVPTVAGWTQVTGGTARNTSDTFRTTWFYRVGAGEGSAGYTADYGASQNYAWIHVVRAQGADVTTVYRNVVASGASASGTNQGVTLAAFADAANNGLLLGVTAQYDGGGAPKAGMTEYYDTTTGLSRNGWTGGRVGEDTTPYRTAGAANYFAAVGFEVLVAVAADVADRGMARGLRRGIGRGLANAMHMVRDEVSGLWKPRDERLVIPVGIALQGV